MEDIVPAGYNEAKESLLAKMEEPINAFLLVKLKLAQLRSYPTQNRNEGIEDRLRQDMIFHANAVYETMAQLIENQ